MKLFTQGSQVVRAGARGDACYVILDGGAQVETPAGHTHKLSEGDYFGELALLDGAPRAATVSAIGSLRTARISRAAFLKLLKDEPAIGVGLAHGRVAIVRDLQEAWAPRGRPRRASSRARGATPLSSGATE